MFEDDPVIYHTVFMDPDNYVVINIHPDLPPAPGNYPDIDTKHVVTLSEDPYHQILQIGKQTAILNEVANGTEEKNPLEDPKMVDVFQKEPLAFIHPFSDMGENQKAIDDVNDFHTTAAKLIPSVATERDV